MTNCIIVRNISSEYKNPIPNSSIISYSGVLLKIRVIKMTQKQPWKEKNCKPDNRPCGAQEKERERERSPCWIAQHIMTFLQKHCCFENADNIFCLFSCDIWFTFQPRVYFRTFSLTAIIHMKTSNIAYSSWKDDLREMSQERGPEMSNGFSKAREVGS